MMMTKLSCCFLLLLSVLVASSIANVRIEEMPSEGLIYFSNKSHCLTAVPSLTFDPNNITTVLAYTPTNIEFRFYNQIDEGLSWSAIINRNGILFEDSGSSFTQWQWGHQVYLLGAQTWSNDPTAKGNCGDHPILTYWANANWVQLRTFRTSPDQIWYFRIKVPTLKCLTYARFPSTPSNAAVSKSLSVPLSWKIEWPTSAYELCFCRKMVVYYGLDSTTLTTTGTSVTLPNCSMTSYTIKVSNGNSETHPKWYWAVKMFAENLDNPSDPTNLITAAKGVCVHQKPSAPTVSMTPSVGRWVMVNTTTTISWEVSDWGYTCGEWNESQRTLKLTLLCNGGVSATIDLGSKGIMKGSVDELLPSHSITTKMNCTATITATWSLSTTTTTWFVTSPDIPEQPPGASSSSSSSLLHSQNPHQQISEGVNTMRSCWLEFMVVVLISILFLS